MPAGDPVRLSRENSTQDPAATVITSTGSNVIQAFSTRPDGRSRAVRGEISSGSSKSAGVYGRASSSDGNPSGVHGESFAPDAVGVLGEARAGTPPAGQQQACAGVKGTCDSAKGVGVLAENRGGGPALKAGSQLDSPNPLITFTVESDSAQIADRETAIWVLIKLGKPPNERLILKRVCVGGPNSAGTGFRVLRVHNDLARGCTPDGPQDV
jgi:hypothetical protein